MSNSGEGLVNLGDKISISHDNGYRYEGTLKGVKMNNIKALRIVLAKGKFSHII